MQNKKLFYHVLAPAIALLLFYSIAWSPVHVFGCRGRGLLALTIVFISLIGAIGAAIKASRSRQRGEDTVRWWVYTSIILALPAIALITMI
jgi:hypothetical protein